jgi:preprotein translocase SecE subunit
MGPTRWVTLSFLVFGALTAIVLSKALGAIAANFGVPDYALLGQGVTASTAISWVTAMGGTFYYYRSEKWHTLATEIVQELRKVVFPSWAETRSATIVVVITTIIIAVILYLFDAIWSGLTSWIYT